MPEYVELVVDVLKIIDNLEKSRGLFHRVVGTRKSIKLYNITYYIVMKVSIKTTDKITFYYFCFGHL